MLGQELDSVHAGTELPLMQSRYGVQPAFVEYGYISADTKYGDMAKHTAMRSALTSHANNGGVVGLSFHFPNFVTGNNVRDRDRASISSVSSLLASASASQAKADWYTYLDGIAESIKSLMDSQGRKVPVAVRLFHEANGWESFYANEGPNGASQIDTRQITSLTGNGSTLTAVLSARPSPASLNFPLQTSSYVQIAGASAGFNGGYYVVSCTPTDDAVGSVATLVLARSNAGAVANGSAAVAGGIYKTSGFWWSGRDRSVALMQLFADVVVYLRYAKKVTNALFYTTPFPVDSFGAHWTSDDSHTDSQGRSLAYSNWYPGAYADLWGMDYYQFTANQSGLADSSSDSVLQESVARIKATSTKPAGICEFGAKVNNKGNDQPGFWVSALNGLTSMGVAGFLVWDESYYPAPTDPAGPSFQSMVADRRLITLAKLNRGW